MPVRSSARRALRPGEAVFPLAACRPRSNRGGSSPACALRTIRRGQATADRGGRIEPFKRALEIAQTLVGLGSIEARLVEAKDWQSSIDIVLRRFADYHDLEGAFGRRAVTERAKGILMERHSVNQTTAFDVLRDHAREPMFA